MTAPDLPFFTIGIIVYPGCDLLDLAGPNEVFTFFDGSAIGRTARVVSVGKTKDAIPAVGAITITPQYDFGDCPPIDLLFVPGGGGDIARVIGDDDFLDFLRLRAANARYVTAVCTGGLLLAAAGLLDGYAATVHWAVVDCLKLFANVAVANGCPRFVHDGNRITGGGISSTIDLSLHMVQIVVQDFTGDADTAAFAAQRIQLMIQYNPQPPFPGGDPCSVDYKIYAPTAAGMKDFHDPVCAAVAERIQHPLPPLSGA